MSKSRHIYLKMKTLKEARQILFERFSSSQPLLKETISVPDAVGRVLAEPVTAVISSPNFHLSAMDGIAVIAATTFGASETRPMELDMDKDAFYVNTGQVMPENTDAVIMIEHVNDMGRGRVEIEAPAFPWQNVRKVGEDIVATELLFPHNHVITPYCVGALLSGGVFRVPVRKKPKVLVIPTGSELVDWRETSLENLSPGQVLETNSFVLGKLIESCDGAFVRHEMLTDDPGIIKEAILDIGINTPNPGTRIFATLKGVVDAGVEIPCNEKMLPSEDRIKGEHIKSYAKLLAKEDKEKYNKHFSKYIEANVKPEDVPNIFKETKAKIDTTE